MASWIINEIGRARAQLLTDHREPARIWLSPQHWCQLMHDPDFFALNWSTNGRPFMGMALTEDSMSKISRVVATDGTAIALRDELENKDA